MILQLQTYELIFLIAMVTKILKQFLLDNAVIKTIQLTFCELN